MNRSIQIAITFLAVTALLVFLSRFSFFSQITDVLVAPIRPIQTRLYAATSDINKFVGNIFYAAELDKTVKDLTEKVIALSKENINLKELEAENENLRRLLEFKEDRNDLNLVVARVAVRSAYEPTVQEINRGELHGLRKGQAVITENGLIVGKLTRVDEFSSQFQLLTDSRSEISATLARIEKPIGILVGERGLSLKLQLIPNDVELKKGDLVITSGLDQEIPSGLIIGHIEEIKKEPNELFQEAIIKTLIPLNNVSLVAAVKK